MFRVALNWTRISTKTTFKHFQVVKLACPELELLCMKEEVLYLNLKGLRAIRALFRPKCA